MKKTLLVLVPVALLLLVVFPFSASVDAVTCPTGGTTTYTVVGGVCVPNGTGLSNKSVAEIFTATLNWLLYIFVALATIAFVVSGFQYITAAGDEKQVDTAKNTMKYAVIGIVVAISGLVIIRTIANILKASTSPLI